MENIPPQTEPAASGLPCHLSPLAARVLGCLFEKEFGTPDLYPLSLNALTNACNQKNNRDPLMALSEADVTGALDELRGQRLAVQFVGAESRTPKYKHKLEQVFEMEPAARAVLCELLVRGPQTAAGLRGNCQRLHRMPEADGFDAILEALASHPKGEIVRKLPRQPGQKEARWGQLLTGEPAHQTEQDVVLRVPATGPMAELERRVADLETTVKLLLEEVESLRRDAAFPSSVSSAEHRAPADF